MTEKDEKKHEEAPAAKWTRWSFYMYNFFYYVFAILLFYSGLRFLYSLQSLRILEFSHVYFVFVFLFVIGCLTLIAGVHACCGAFWQNRTVLYVFIGIMWLILACELGLAIWLFYNLPLMKASVLVQMHTLMQEYVISHDHSVDNIQYTFECCGVLYHTDWLNTTWGQANLGSVPGSCCSSLNTTCDVTSTAVAQQGCEDPLKKELDFICTFVMAVLLICAFVQCVGISLSYALTRLIRDYGVIEES